MEKISRARIEGALDALERNVPIEVVTGALRGEPFTPPRNEKITIPRLIGTLFRGRMQR